MILRNPFISKERQRNGALIIKSATAMLENIQKHPYGNIEDNYECVVKACQMLNNGAKVCGFRNIYDWYKYMDKKYSKRVEG